MKANAKKPAMQTLPFPPTNLLSEKIIIDSKRHSDHWHQLPGECICTRI